MLLESALMHVSLLSHLCLTDAVIRLTWHPNVLQKKAYAQQDEAVYLICALCLLRQTWTIACGPALADAAVFAALRVAEPPQHCNKCTVIWLYCNWRHRHKHVHEHWTWYSSPPVPKNNIADSIAVHVNALIWPPREQGTGEQSSSYSTQSVERTHTCPSMLSSSRLPWTGESELSLPVSGCLDECPACIQKAGVRQRVCSDCVW